MTSGQIDTTLSLKLGLKGPLIVAPLGGGPTTPELVAAASNAGALGSLAGAYLTPEELEKAIERTRFLTSKPFAINLFAPIPEPQLSSEEIKSALDATRKYRTELGLPDPIIITPFHQNFEKQFSVVLRAKPKAFSFVFGIPEQKFLKECHKEGILTIGTATTLDEGIQLQEADVDMIVAQGIEAGGHRGMFRADQEDSRLETLHLTESLVKNLKVPIIAAGGIMDGQGIAAALNRGAQAAMLGTAFLACDEAGTSKAYREILLSPANLQTRLTLAFSGRLARGIENRFMKEMDQKLSSMLPFPAQNLLTRDIRSKAAQTNQAHLLSLWAGTGVRSIRKMTAANLIEQLFNELHEAIRVLP